MASWASRATLRKEEDSFSIVSLLQKARLRERRLPVLCTMYYVSNAYSRAMKRLLNRKKLYLLILHTVYYYMVQYCIANIWLLPVKEEERCSAVRNPSFSPSALLRILLYIQ